jgi:hypothetical protein
MSIKFTSKRARHPVVAKKVEVLEKWFPAGWDDDGFYQGAENWSFKRIAWEFLRRNPKYQEVCDQHKPARGPRQKRWPELARPYGRVSLDSYRMDFADDGRHPNEWFEGFELVGGYEDQRLPEDRVFTLRDGEIAILFDLDSTARAGNAVIKSAMERIEKLLRLEAHHYASRLELDSEWGNSRAVKKANMFKPPSKTLLLRYLRLYDAIEIFHASHREVMKFYGSRYADFDNDPLFRIAVKNKISKNLNEAKRYVNEKYITLLPLDISR